MFHASNSFAELNLRDSAAGSSKTENCNGNFRGLSGRLLQPNCPHGIEFGDAVRRHGARQQGSSRENEDGAGD
jgi:hypothetical protein